MPIYNGNYVAPVWVNNQPPAINETELLAMSQTIQASQILHGSGAPTQYTSGIAGQRYADTSTTPPTIYKLKAAAEDANVWELDDSEGNIALDYSSSATYSEGDYCIYAGALYKAAQDISTAESWTAAHWQRALVADDLADHVANQSNPHEVTAPQTGALPSNKIAFIEPSGKAENRVYYPGDCVVLFPYTQPSLHIVTSYIGYDTYFSIGNNVTPAVILTDVKANKDMLATVEDVQASKAYAVDDYLVKGGALYKVTQPIAQYGGIYTFGDQTNVVAVKLADEVAGLSGVINKPPRINSSGYWEVWDQNTNAYVSTGYSVVVNPPMVANTASEMTNHGQVYVYNGNESGYQHGYWYYWDGSAWTAGAAYQVAATDKTLTVADAAADAKATGDAVGELKSATDIFNLANLANHTAQTVAGVDFAYNGNNTWSASKTASGISAYILFSNNASVKPFEAGKEYQVFFSSTSQNLYIQFYKYVGATLTFFGEATGDRSITIPSDATGILIRIRVTGTVNDTCTFNIYPMTEFVEKCLEAFSDIVDIQSDIVDIQSELPQKLGYVKVLTSADDMDDYGETGAYCYLSTSKPTHAPDIDSNAVVFVIHGFSTRGFATQIFCTNNGHFCFRNQFTNGVWTAYTDLSVSGGGGGTVIENTYNITTSPTITTDTNGWLQSVDTDTSDETGKTDMTGAIMSMLTDTGYCHLGEGIFYVSGNIDMPEGSMLCGCGKKSEIRLLQSTTSGYCVKLQKYCTIENVSFSGARSFTVPTSMGTRNGIVFAANYDGSEGDTAYTTEHCMINNVWIKYFSGAGIYGHNTSINYNKGLYVTNVNIYACYAGINLDYYCEFCKFENVCTAWCKIGCINNCGNNVFTSCTFHATAIGYKVDGSQPNSAHSTINGCTFCHIGSNAGSAITLDGITAGFVISNCQIWYNSIDITDCSGIVFSGCEFGRGTAGGGATINITGGGLIMFTGCVFMNDVAYPPDINITNNTKAKFDACYGSVSGNAISA